MLVKRRARLGPASSTPTVVSAAAVGRAQRTSKLAAVALSALVAAPLQVTLPSAGVGARRLAYTATQQHRTAAPMSSCASSRTGPAPSPSSLEASWPSYGGNPANTHTAIFVSNGKRLFALDAKKGTIVWSHPEQDVLGNPVFVTDQGSVFAPTTAGPWQAYSTATGQERPGFRSHVTGADVGQAATGSRDVVFFPTVLGVLKAIDASTGRTLWTTPGSTAPPAIAGIQDKTSSAAVAGSAMVVFVGRSTGAFLVLYGLR